MARHEGERDAGRWVRSQRCTAGNCLEIRIHSTGVQVRDSKQNALGSSQPVLSLSRAEWNDFTRDVVAGSFDELSTNIRRDNRGGVTLTRDGTILNFEVDEWTAFVGGLADGDFD